MKSLDTNVALRYLLNDVPAQTARVKALLIKSPHYVSDVVVCEIAFVLENAMLLNRSSVAHLISMLIAVPGLISSTFLPDVIDLYLNKPTLSFVDCYSSIEAKVLGCDLYTFDRKLLNQGGSHVLMP